MPVMSDRVQHKIIEIPPYLTEWALNQESIRCLRMMDGDHQVYLLDMRLVKNLYKATAALIGRLISHTSHIGASLYLINVSQPLGNSLHALGIDSKIPVCTIREGVLENAA
jgi:hypothetical protein